MVNENARNALELQRLVVRCANEENVTMKELCLLTRAFIELEHLKRVMRGAGLPKAVDYEKAKRARLLDAKIVNVLADDPNEPAQLANANAPPENSLKESLLDPDRPHATTPAAQTGKSTLIEKALMREALLPSERKRKRKVRKDAVGGTEEGARGEVRKVSKRVDTVMERAAKRRAIYEMAVREGRDTKRLFEGRPPAFYPEVEEGGEEGEAEERGIEAKGTEDEGNDATRPERAGGEELGGGTLEE